MRISSKKERLTYRLTSPYVFICGRSVCAYQVFGIVGLALAVALVAFLAFVQELSVLVVAEILLVGVATFFLLILGRLAVTGEEHITYYHHELAILAAATLLLRVSGQPILPYLDLTILGIGLFLAFGRVGCFRMGCCHGRPHPHGVRYRQEHTDAGFCSQYVGVTLFPVQLIESGLVLVTVIAGSAIVLSGGPPGSAMSLYVVGYGIGRFLFEFMRGDPGRLYLWGFSEAQWLSITLIVGVIAAETRGRLPFTYWHIAGGLSLLIVMISVAVRRARDRAGLHRLLSARHIGELAEALDRIGRVSVGFVPGRRLGNQPQISIARTSLGVLISNGNVATQESRLSHYTLSRRDQWMSLSSARAIARVIRQLTGAEGACRIVEGKHGVFHVLISNV